MPSDDDDLAGVALAVLAGGEGARMGFPKAEIRLHGRPILQVLLQQFAWSGPTLLVTAPGREHPTGWKGFTMEVVDASAGQGPLRGVLTALENAPVRQVVVTAVDMPAVRQHHLRWVARALMDRPATNGVMLREKEVGLVQPFPSAFTVDAIPVLKRSLEQGRRSLHGLLNDSTVVAVDAPADWPAEVWTNLNSPADVESAQN